jgi:patatin-like phospholipase/acyl hydrolase
MRVLAIDGGGIRGLIPALVLADVERRTGRRVAELFDLIAGTSTGGIIAAALARPQPLAAAELAALYEQEGPKIFHRSLLKRIESVDGNLDERYDDGGLNAALERFLGGARLSAAKPDLLITAYDIEDRSAFFFRSTRARADPSQDFTLAAAARATSAAPTYFEPALVNDLAGRASFALVDGGVFAVNPSMCAYAELAHGGRAGDIALLASLGTGSHTRPIRYADAKGWGRLQWAAPIIDVVFDGVADTIEFETTQLLPPPRSIRLQTELREASDDLDDASASNLAALRREAERLLRERAADVEALCAALTA